MDGHLAGLEFNIHGLSQTFRIDYGLIQDIRFVVLTERVSQMAQMMRAGDVTHTRILDAGIIYRQPSRYRH